MLAVSLEYGNKNGTGSNDRTILLQRLCIPRKVYSKLAAGIN